MREEATSRTFAVVEEIRACQDVRKLLQELSNFLGRGRDSSLSQLSVASACVSEVAWNSEALALEAIRLLFLISREFFQGNNDPSIWTSAGNLDIRPSACRPVG